MARSEEGKAVWGHNAEPKDDEDQESQASETFLALIPSAGKIEADLLVRINGWLAGASQYGN